MSTTLTPLRRRQCAVHDPKTPAPITAMSQVLAMNSFVNQLGDNHPVSFAGDKHYYVLIGSHCKIRGPSTRVPGLRRFAIWDGSERRFCGCWVNVIQWLQPRQQLLWNRRKPAQMPISLPPSLTFWEGSCAFCFGQQHTLSIAST